MTKEEAISYWITHKLSFLRYHFGKGKKTLPWLNVVCCEHYVSRLRGEIVNVQAANGVAVIIILNG